jgi:hypothetical protein
MKHIFRADDLDDFRDDIHVLTSYAYGALGIQKMNKFGHLRGALIWLLFSYKVTIVNEVKNCQGQNKTSA